MEAFLNLRDVQLCKYVVKFVLKVISSPFQGFVLTVG